MMLIMIVGMSSCVNKCESPASIIFGSIEESRLLEGDTLDTLLDDIYILGDVAVIDDGYVFYQYDSDCFLLYFNPDTGRQVPFAVKGEGPGEITSVSGTFGQALDSSGSFTVFDPNKSKLFSCSRANDFTLEERCAYPSGFKKYVPFNILVLKNGKYVSPRGDFKYGMVAYDSQSGDVMEWSLGYEFDDLEHPDGDIVSSRSVSYSPKNGLVAETYGKLPVVILHDEEGDISGLVRYKPSDAPVSGESMTIHDTALTDNLMWILCSDPDAEVNSIVYVLNYEGNEVACFEITPSITITIDVERRKLIAVNPNNDGANAISYTLPVNLGEL